MKRLFKDIGLSSIFSMATFMDKILLIFLVAFTIASFFFIKELFPSGNLVKISVDNKTAYSIPLNEDRIGAVRGPLGESVVETRNMKVHMKDSPCPDKICIQQGWIGRGAIVCLPNKVVVTVGGDEQLSEGPEYDAVTK